MRKLLRDLQAVAVVVWVGSLWTMGLLVAPMLFRVLPDRVVAGAVAGRLFSVVAYVGFACAACLILLALARSRRDTVSRRFLWLVVAMAVLVAVGELGVQPMLASLKATAAPADVMQSPLRGEFATWHGIAMGAYLANCVLGLLLVLVQNRLGRD